MANTHRIEIHRRPELLDPRREEILGLAREFGIGSLTDLRRCAVYVFAGDPGPDELERLAAELLCDPVTETWRIGPPQEPEQGTALSISYRAGVREPILHSLEAGLEDLGIRSLEALGTAERIVFGGRIEPELVRLFAERYLFNPLARRIGEPGPRQTLAAPASTGHEVPLRELEGEALLEISRRGTLALNLAEMETVREHYRTLGREPTEIELETIAQTWSEHCVHKTFKARVRHGEQTIANLLQDTIAAATERLDKPWCVSVFKDNAGIVRFNERFDLCFKAETHNHPSAIDPYGGSATGLGGVIRDILGAGLGARPILGLDVFCVGPQDLDARLLPEGTMHPRRILEGVVAGVRDYGNRMGLPTAVGGLWIGPGYVANPVMLGGCVGVMPRDMHEKAARPGDLAILVGGRTGIDGIHGVTFSSEALTAESEELDRSAVQIGDPIVEQMMIDPLLRARDERLFSAITDCGGGGLSSALGEMGEDTGVEVWLDRVPLKEPGLTPTEIWISESQERMILAVPPELEERALALFRAEGVLATTIGRFTDDRRLTLKHGDETLGDLGMDFLHDGLPQRELVSTEPRVDRGPTPLPPDRPDWEESLMVCLGHDNVRSREEIIRQYDHEVQGRTVRGPFAGPHQGPQDACVILPDRDSDAGALVAIGFNPLFSRDPWRMAANAIDEAVRNLVAAGGDPDRIALLDNFIWGDVSDPDELGKLVEACLACRDVALGFEAPFVSGKDSLNNTHIGRDGHKKSVTPTLIISAMTMTDDVKTTVGSALTGVGNRLLLLGETRSELGGSTWLDAMEMDAGAVPEVDPAAHLARASKLHKLMKAGRIAACHDLAEGGLGVAAAEMALASGLGAKLALDDVAAGLELDELLFSESSGRYLLEVAAENVEAVTAALADESLVELGEVIDEPLFIIVHGEEERGMPTAALRFAWAGREF